ncbi:response regulator [Paenibacillus flagellatus]|uniref:DNA-binding response regulator n=1 Tax=Paenibacillus flagellatus TaxID=2211139 RepID=A0A2V5K450_9BACL|nr:response regulator [Paenibacillus flagellatus]PYI54031.1 DNA-binding response regulator [Paenibacillus flagellatus]
MTRDKLTVLVVDDELPLRQELRLFPWESHGFELAGEAENGEEALRFIRDFSPDIVVTDITMPVMDGLELFRAVKEEQPDIPFILLTCHSEFDYAREAVRLGAADYLIKVMMEPADLERALLKAKDAILRGRSIRSGEIEERRWERSRAMARIASAPAADGADLEAVLSESFGLSLPVTLASVHVEAKRESRHLAKREVEAMLTALERPHSPFSWLPAEDGVYLLVFDQEASRPAYIRDALETLTKKMADELTERLSFLGEPAALYAILGEPVKQPEQFQDVYRSVVRAYPLRFYDPAGLVFLSKSSPFPEKPDEAAVADMAGKLRRVKGNRPKLAELLRVELPRWAVKYGVSPDALKGLVTEWRHEWLEHADDSVRLSAGVKEIADAGSVEELVAVLVRELESESGQRRKTRKEIADAKRYIDEHLNQPLTLARVAEHVSLSPAYLSRLFRDETGVSFHDHITRSRMERAVRLLQTTSLRVYEVGIAVGIPSYRYFASTFREYTGVPPTEYRKG